MEIKRKNHVEIAIGKKVVWSSVLTLFQTGTVRMILLECKYFASANFNTVRPLNYIPKKSESHISGKCVRIKCYYDAYRVAVILVNYKSVNNYNLTCVLFRR